MFGHFIVVGIPAIAIGVGYVVVVGHTLQHEAFAFLESSHRPVGPGTVVPLPSRPTVREAPLERRASRR
jgi:hypothetical protein